MKKIAAAALLIVALASAAAFHASAQTREGDMPPGVSKEMWHPLSDRLGIILRVERGSRSETILGTLVVREGTTWRPVNLSAPAGLVPAR